MAENYVLLETIQLNQNAASVTFDNIPQTGYTDLVVKVSSRRDSSVGSGSFQIRLNGDSGSNYSARMGYGNGSSAGSFTDSGTSMYAGEIGNSTDTANTFPSTELYIPNYLSGTAKSLSSDSVTENNATLAYAVLTAGLWTGTAAINSVQIFPAGSGSIVQYSTFSLYGVADVNTTPVTAPKATGGNIVANDGTYWYHAFLSSGTFTPQTPITCDYLVVAGGGGGGGSTGNLADGGGGGAGGLRSTVDATGGTGSLETAISLTAGTGYTVTVGAGGAGGSGSETTIASHGSNGGASVFGSISTVGGGGGGARANAGNPSIHDGNVGGSGGGSANLNGVVNNTTVAGTANEGFAGGGSNNVTSLPGGGGGGAGGAGGTGNPNGGTGGVGRSISITGSSVDYAGGGGGSTRTGGTGGTASFGGGAGALNGAGSAGSTNTGGGGGGGTIPSSGSGQGGSGGSGIVIIRYAMA